ncbi:MAG TPA: OmpH family outer membrane protein [Candidatus Angelobacter sp.]|nr:OmpH family outer membrane protein [Candidatus Angelobacter sp.]
MFRSFKMYITVLSLALSALFTSAAVAQAAATHTDTPAAAPAGNKIAIVNIQQAISASNEGKKEFDALQQKFSPKQVQLKNENDEVENLKKQLQTQGDKLSEEERNSRVQTLEIKQKTLQRNLQDAQDEYQQAEQQVVNRIGSKMLNVLETYARTHGYSIVLDVSNPQTPVLYASTNITKELVDAYNAAVPVPAAPAAKTPSKPSARSTPPSAPRPATPKKP